MGTRDRRVALEKIYGSNKVRESGGYVELSIPPDAINDPKLPIGKGTEVEIVGQFDRDEQKLVIRPVEVDR